MTEQVKPGPETPETRWWTLTAGETTSRLQTDAINGLTRAKVEKQLEIHGENSLPEEERDSLLKSIVEAFKDPLALVLTVAAVVSAGIGLYDGDSTKLQQAVWIMGIVLFMTLVGFYTDYFSNQEMERLKKLQVERTTVIRDGERLVVEARELVPGDIVVLAQGDKVPADGRILEATNASTDEQIFTGEARDIEKSGSRVLSPDMPLAERANMILGGTFVTSGMLTAAITATGVHSELGKIWKDLTKTQDVPTPLQDQLEELGQLLLRGTLIVCVLVVGIYVIVQKFPLLDAAIVAVALAIAFIPEALGAIIMIALALGAREMVRKQTIIREKYAAEGLGSVSIIATDKTGTVTYGRMSATHLWEPTHGSIRIDDQNWTHTTPEVSRMLDVVRFANNLKDPTDDALGRLAEKAFRPITPELRVFRRSELPFSSFRKRMSTLDAMPESMPVLNVKGAPSIILTLCSTIREQGTLRPITTEDREKISAQIVDFESEGYRVLALAQKEWAEPLRDIHESDEAELTFLGMVAISDPPRHEVKATINTLRRAGIAVKMITGDSPITAMSIAREVGLIPRNAERSTVVLESHDLQAIIAAAGIAEGDAPAKNFTQAQLDRIANAAIFSRVTPMDKKIIIAALQQNGALVSMVGDGVNDALAIKQANVGIAMSTGTELAKAVSRAVLTGSYEALASAVQVGRTILHRARLYIHALLSTNGAEVGVFIVAALAGWHTPLTAVQLLVINLLGDSWLSIALATEKEEADVMDKPPRPADQPVITPYMWFSIGLQSLVATVIMTIAFVAARHETDLMGLGDTPAALAIQQTAVFITFMVQKILRSAFTARSLRYNLWEIGFFTNKWSLVAAAVTIVIAFMAIYVLPVGMSKDVPASLLPLLFGMGLIPPVVEEAVKLVLKFRREPAAKPKPAEA